MNSDKTLIVVHQTPLIDDNGDVYYYSEVSLDEFRKLAGKFLNLLKIAKEVTKIALNDLGLCNNLQGVESTICALNVLANAISITFRRYFMVPLLPPSRDGESVALRPTNSDLIYLWVLAESGNRKDIINLLDDLDKLVEAYSVGKFNTYVHKLFVETVKNFDKPVVISEEEAEERLKLLLYLPADTRPGPSISKLIPHLLTVAGLAHVIYLSKKVGSGGSIDNKDMLNIAILRLAALLHDIGKPSTWIEMFLESKYTHAEASIDIIENKLKLIDEDLCQRFGLSEAYEALKTVIELHHAKDIMERHIKIHGIDVDIRELVEVLRNADIASSSMDRLGKVFARVSEAIVRDLVKNQDFTVEDLFIKSGDEIFKFWNSVTRDKLLEIAKNIVGSISSHSLPQELLNCESWGYEPDVKVLILDVASIQKFIRRESIRILTSASTIVDLITVFAIPKSIIEVLNLSLDSIIYAGGGFVIALVPSWTTEEYIENALAKTRKFLGSGISLDVNYAISNVNRSWPCTIREATARLAVKKNMPTDIQGKMFATGYEVLCEWCSRRIATKRYRSELICDECYRLFVLGTRMYVEHKLKILSESGYKYAEKILGDQLNLYQYLIEWLSGVELEEAPSIRRNIALVKVDGNAVGTFMASAINITEAMCRSIRIDMGMKIGIAVALKKVLDIGRETEALVTRLYAGLLYSGGDDMMAIWPSSISIPVAFSIAKTFWKVNGGAVALSISIVSAKPKHNIWNIVDVADFLLDECKKMFRAKLFKVLGPKLIAVASIMRGSQQLFKAEVKSVLDRYRSLGLSYQPFILSADTSPSELKCNDLSNLVSELLEKTIDVPIPSTPSTIDAVVNKLFALSFSSSISKVRRAIREIFTTFRSYSIDKTIVSLSLARSSERERDSVMSSIQKGLAKLYIECPQLPTQKQGLAPLFDIYHVVKVYEGD